MNPPRARQMWLGANVATSCDSPWLGIFNLTGNVDLFSSIVRPPLISSSPSSSCTHSPQA